MRLVEGIHRTAGPLRRPVPADLDRNRAAASFHDEVHFAVAPPVAHGAESSPEQEVGRALQLLAAILPGGRDRHPAQAGVDGIKLAVPRRPLPGRPGEEGAAEREVGRLGRLDIQARGIDRDAEAGGRPAHAHLGACRFIQHLHELPQRPARAGRHPLPHVALDDVLKIPAQQQVVVPRHGRRREATGGEVVGQRGSRSR